MKSSKTEKFIFLAVLVLGAAVRLYRFGTVPAGLNQDEAFAAYESWALLTAGVDSSLHAWPVYLTAWGSGMNALETYLLLPLIALFGTKTWVIRLPQLLVSLLSIFAAWRLGRRIGTARTGLFFALLLAVCPWHVTMSRWGLESNLAPGFLLFGLCCFLRGLEERRFLLPSALFYGLALYAYSAIWPVMPLLLGLLVLYFRPKADRYLLGAGLILAVLALPLVAFLAVNYGWVGEFSLGPFSVPKLVELRAEDISLTAIPENLKTLCRVLFARSDGLVWNSPVPFGLFHPVSVPLALFGLGALVWRFARSMRGKAKDPAAALLIQIFAGFCLCLVITVNANRMNFLLLPLVLCAALGADALCSLAGRHAAKLAVGLAAAYLIFFGLFARSYFTDYADALRGQFTWGVQDALETALAHEGTVYVTDAVSYSKLLLIAEIDPYTFNETVEYERYPAAYLSARRIGRWRFCPDKRMPFDPAGVYVLWGSTDPAPYVGAGFTAERHGWFIVLWRE